MYNIYTQTTKHVHFTSFFWTQYNNKPSIVPIADVLYTYDFFWIQNLNPSFCIKFYNNYQNKTNIMPHNMSSTTANCTNNYWIFNNNYFWRAIDHDIRWYTLMVVSLIIEGKKICVYGVQGLEKIMLVNTACRSLQVSLTHCAFIHALLRLVV